MEDLKELRALVEPEGRWDTEADAHTTTRIALLAILAMLDGMTEQLAALQARSDVAAGFQSFTREWMRRAMDDERRIP